MKKNKYNPPIHIHNELHENITICDNLKNQLSQEILNKLNPILRSSLTDNFHELYFCIRDEILI